ncbi:MAG: hypothetical protein GX149_04505 [Acholeplasmataceae bacterium]|jgi:ribosome maturation factor RimP|nr:hypothetical protein [Acholeplasmataceae bacterium]
MNLEKIKTIIIPILTNYNLELYSLKTKRQFGMAILEVLVDGDDIDASFLAKVNQKLNDAIDPELPKNYYLEVSTAGAERPLNSLNQAAKHVGKYLLLETAKEKIKGVLEEVKAESLVLKVNLKGVIKKIEIAESEIVKMMLTVKY